MEYLAYITKVEYIANIEYKAYKEGITKNTLDKLIEDVSFIRLTNRRATALTTLF